MIREFFRYFALIPGWLYHWIFFTPKTYYEDKSVQGKRVKGGALVRSNVPGDDRPRFLPLPFGETPEGASFIDW